MKYWMLTALMCLAGCSAHSVERSKPDEAYQSSMATGRSAFELGHPEEAERQYKRAFERALLRDDAQALHDAGFNLATAQLEQQHTNDVQKTLDRVQAALSLRGEPEVGDLKLIRSAAFLRQNLPSNALRQAREAQAEVSSADRTQAAYLIGRAAFDLRDGATLSEAVISSCKGAESALPSADCTELKARQALLSGQAGEALKLALVVVGQRRDARDYVSMREALALAASSAMRDGRGQEAASLRARLHDSAEVLR
ncbi:hypothetical protein AA106555_1128 [Neokomagataea thailandica NBRC 106555]|uniref:Tetratricopeptide repeat protein n=2 Tax=Neokomagataea TaxID=1223423 RepID=A0A4Y6V2R5_9PROT|nr:MULTISPECIES: hypothetical protein [Neokomagataea]QDH24273.1 hypothetical protein D5366_02255 [Neokomagataea tanensis]GBR53003.1 hypothetical protein AA106555_1128 [Neokomagataea thailandica NBRC 106555]